MKVDLIGSQSHYRAHCQPIWDALPDDLKGKVHPKLSIAEPCAEDRVALVGGWLDVQPLRGRCKMIYVEHGAGQTYQGDEKFKDLPGYSASGGRRHEGVIGFIAPSQTVADRWTTAPSIAVGCPKMDPWFDGRYPHPPLTPRSVCFAWHWEEPNWYLPEMRSAFTHYRPLLPAIVQHFKNQGYKVYGHAHPRWRGQLDDEMDAMGMSILMFDTQVFGLASMLILDNSSIGYEFASLDRPTIWLDAPWYRRDVHHGLRFWDPTPGPRVANPEELLALDLQHVLDVDNVWRVHRDRVLRQVYEYRDGSSSQRAADFVTSLVREM